MRRRPRDFSKHGGHFREDSRSPAAQGASLFEIREAPGLAD
jgi:hypothetical protein